jgi:hypothetical protein
MVIVMFRNAFMLIIINFVLMMKLSYIDYFDGYDFIMLLYVYFVILFHNVEVQFVLTIQAALFLIAFADNTNEDDCILGS